MSRGIYKIFTYSPSCHHLCLFQGFSGTECVADFVSHGEIGVVDRVEGALIVKVVVSKNIYFLFVHVIRYCSVPDHHHFE